MNQKLQEKLGKIKLLALDFDGVMTNGYVNVDQDGKEMVQCSRIDSMGIGILQKNGIPVIVISTEANQTVTKRCEKIKVKCWQKVESTQGKLEILKSHAEELGLHPEEIAFMGDDVNDIAALEFAGVAFTVYDGHKLVKKIADYITEAKRGEHAVREVCELIMESRGIFPAY